MEYCLAIGSNWEHPQHMEQARRWLKELFPDIRFSAEEETLPVGALYLAGCLILRLRARKRAGLKPAKQVESAALPGQAAEAIPPAAPEAAQRSLALSFEVGVH